MWPGGASRATAEGYGQGPIHHSFWVAFGPQKHTILPVPLYYTVRIGRAFRSIPLGSPHWQGSDKFVTATDDIIHSLLASNRPIPNGPHPYLSPTLEDGQWPIIVHEHTRVGTGFHCTALVAAHCPALTTGLVMVGNAASALASNVPALERSSYFFLIQTESPKQTLCNQMCSTTM